MGREIDIRIMNLNKWYIPKSFSTDELDYPVVLGYFDALQVRGIQIDQEQLHPFVAGYMQQENKKTEEKKNLVDYSSQEQMLFLSICQEGEEEDGVYFMRDTVNSFWNDETCPYIFLSMIHINHSGKLRQALQKIKDVFVENYLSYISFDYCDIVLFAHNTQIGEFMCQIKRLFEVEKREDAVIFDSFSMVSFQPDIIKNEDWIGCAKICGQERTQFQATINLSIRNYEKFTYWYEKLLDLNTNIERYNMFGRHDISIVNEYADTAWLMQVMEMLHSVDSRKIFWTFETYIKIQDPGGVIMMPDEPNYLDDVYNYIKGKLDKEIKGSSEIEGLEKIISQSDFRDKGRYLLPIYEVRDCICSIVKNSFAEEFIYCIYESFLHFLSYIKKEITHMREEKGNSISCERRIAKEYDNYFTALNTLVNSTMHNERQFVQATAFNAVFYSVPPKIMAFYNAYIYRIKQILRDAECEEEYTFLIYPSFSPSIFVEQISLDDNLPVDRLLTVRISEKSLYDIESVMYQMVHELAHYVGNDLRCRLERKQKIMDTLVKYIVAECEMDYETYQALMAFVRKNMQSYDKNEHKRMPDYLRNMNLEGQKLVQMLEYEQVRQDLFKEYYQEKIDKGETLYDELLEKLGIEDVSQNAYITSLLPQYCSIKSDELYENWTNINSEEAIVEYINYIELLKSAYSESYADLQMILVLAMDVKDYLSTFFIKQNISTIDMLSDADLMLRISTIYRVMEDSGIWTESVWGQEKEFDEILACIKAYNREVGEASVESKANIQYIREMFEQYDFNNGIKFKQSDTEQRDKYKQFCTEIGNIFPVNDAAIGLYEYLLEVMKKSLKEYTIPTKQKMVKNVRKIVGRMLSFGDTAEVFDCIEEELKCYKQEGCKINP